MSRLTINSNIPSLNAQRSLSNATKKLGDSYTRLSSGLRINKASDDAAGLSISESLKSDTRLFNQGVRNLNDGVSVLSIADGALGELSNIVIRLNELAEQAATGTLGNKQRLALDQEAQSLSKEYNRIARSTEFNGRKIFNGDYGDLSLAAGGGRETLIVEDLGGAVGDGSFASAPLITVTGQNPYALISGDYNGDNIVDFVSAQVSNSAVALYIGNGNGTFKTQITYGVSSAPTQLKSLDVNGDGLEDILSSDLSGISVLISNGDGSFKAHTSYAINGSSYSLDVGDFNQDGALDILVGEYSASGIGIMFGNSNGTFKAKQSFDTLTSPVSLAVTDFNGDGILDFAAASELGSGISLFIGNGNGSFKMSNLLAEVAYSRYLDTYDANGDGFADIISVEPAATSVNVYLNNGNGTFRGLTSYASGFVPISVDHGDFNGDGINDLLVSNYNGASADIFIGNSDGSFSTRTSYATGALTYLSVIDDFNGDGVLDFASPQQSGSAISIYLGNSNSGVSALQSFSLRTQQDAKDSMSYLRKTLERIGQQRGHIGAFQSRVEFATNNLQTSALSYQEANSRITDIDVAKESSRLAATQILQRSAASILAQANQQPTLVLSLLRNF